METFSVMVVVAFDLQGEFFCSFYLQVQHSFSQSLDSFQFLNRLRSQLSEYCVLVVHERTRGQGDCESAVVGVLLADACQKTWSVMQKLEWFISESVSENRAISLG